MASITSIISLLVLLLATYTYSIPSEAMYNGLVSKYSGSFSKRIAGHGSIHDSTSESDKHSANKSNENGASGRNVADSSYTTLATETTSEMHHKRSVDDHTTERGAELEFTTLATETTSEMHHERSVDENTTERLTERDAELDFTTFATETTSEMHHERSVDENTTERLTERDPELDFTTSVVETTSEMHHERSVDENTTERLTERDAELEFTTLATETTSEMHHERSVDENTTERQVEKRDEFPQESTLNNFLFTSTALDGTTENSHNARHQDDEFSTTLETSTEFNDRARKLNEHATMINNNDINTEHFQGHQGRYQTIETIVPGEVMNFRINDGPVRTEGDDISVVHYSPSLSPGSTLLLFLLAALILCAFFAASIIAIFTINRTLQTKSPITEMEAELEKS